MTMCSGLNKDYLPFCMSLIRKLTISEPLETNDNYRYKLKNKRCVGRLSLFNLKNSQIHQPYDKTYYNTSPSLLVIKNKETFSNVIKNLQYYEMLFSKR